MSRSKKVLRGVAWVGAGLAALGLVGACGLGPIVKCVMTPGGAFDAEAPPAEPDYGKPGSWSALPERADLADRAPDGEAAVEVGKAGVDVFYVHPTSYVGGKWNASTEDASLNEATDRVATGIQASAFNGCGAVYAPRYRQANGTAFLQASADGDRAVELAVNDVKRAFDAFNARRGAGRPFILASHSQGSIVAERLLFEAISGKPLREQLVAAYLIGGGLTVDGLAKGAPDVPVCRAADDVGCVVAYNARGPDYAGSEFDLHRRDAGEWVCTNPLSWRADGEAAGKELNRGAVFLETDNHAPRLGFADARCVKGTLVVTHIEPAPRDLPSRILDGLMGSQNYHPIEYQIFFMNLRENARVRVAAFEAARKR